MPVRSLGRIVALAVALTGSVDSFGTSYRSTEDELLSSGLSVEPSVLVGYLKTGIPADRVPLTQRSSTGFLHRLDRWGQYRTIVKYLGESKYDDAVPVLIALIDEELPEALQHDLDVHVVGYWHDHTLEERDATREGGIDILRSICADAALRLNHFRNDPELRAHLQSQRENPHALKSNAGPRRQPNPQSLRDHVALADQRREWSTPGVHWPSVKWLAANGPEQIRGLRRIAKDRNETPYVRGEALYWYARFGGEKSYRLLRRYAVGDIRSEREDEDATVQRRALGLMVEWFPDRVDAAAQMAALDDEPAARDAVRILSRHSRNFPFLVENIETMSPGMKAFVVQILARAGEFFSPTVFFDAILGEDLDRAVYGYIGIRRFNLMGDLDVDTMSTLSRWKSNPEFLVELLGTRSNVEPPGEICEQIFECVEGTDVQAARIYRRLYEFLNMPPGVIADSDTANAFSARAWSGFMRCVRAYEETRSR